MFAFAHEIRTYLRTVITRLQLVQHNAGGDLPEAARSMLQEATVAASEIGELVTAMVAYSDAEPAATTMKLGLLLRGALLDRQSALQQAGGEVDLANDLDLSVPSALQTVVKELLTNAIKFRDPQRPLRIRVETRLLGADRVEISVADNGIGVAAAYLDKIFVPFHRLHPRDRYAGFGLGLATSRRIASTWGGTVIAHSGDGEGLTVRVTV